MNWRIAAELLAELRRRLSAKLTRLAPWLGPVLERGGRLPRRVFILAGVGVVVLAVAVIVRTRSGPEDDAPTDQFMQFRCLSCGHTFALSHREFERLWDRREFHSAPDGHSLRYMCPECGQMTAARAEPNRAPAAPNAPPPG